MKIEPMHKFTIVWYSDEHFTVFFDKERIGSYCHDEDGWHGMEAIESIVNQIAEILGAEIETIYDREYEAESI